MLIEVMRMRIMNNEINFRNAEKEAGGDEKLIFKFAWPNMTYVMHLTHEHIDLTRNLARSHSWQRDPLERYVCVVFISVRTPTYRNPIDRPLSPSFSTY